MATDFNKFKKMYDKLMEELEEEVDSLFPFQLRVLVETLAKHRVNDTTNKFIEDIR